MTEFRKSPQGDYFFAHKNNELVIIHLATDNFSNSYMWLLEKESSVKGNWERYNTFYEKCENTTIEEYKKAKQLYVDLVDYCLLK